MEFRPRSGKVSISPQEIYAIGFADGRRGDIRRGTFMLQKWEPKELQCYNRGYNDGLQRLLECLRVTPDSSTETPFIASLAHGGEGD